MSYLDITFHILLIVTIRLIQAQRNTTQIDKYRADFMNQLTQKIPFQVFLNVQNKIANNDPKSVKDPDLVSFYLYTNRSPKKAINIATDTRMVNAKLPIKMLVHGWTEAYDVFWIKNITAAYFHTGRYNVIVIDYSKRGNENYLAASMSVKEVGDIVGNYVVQKLLRERKVLLKNIHLISHSLGAHVAGMTGQRVRELRGSRLGRITALDPAAPIFDLITVGLNERLSSDDAKFVDIVHTDGGNLGFRFAIGTVDFFPNGGTATQPGCSLAKADVQYQDLFCSHARSHIFFLRSIYLKEFIAIPCESWDTYQLGLCDKNTPTYFGESVTNNISGMHFLKLPEEPLKNIKIK